MESLSRPPHRRKHSNATSAFSSSFSLKNTYDGVLLSSGGKTKPFEAHEYSEIFSGSSSIPVLDLSALDERVGSGDGRSSSKLDYTNIFGGLRDDDVAVPYEELLNGGSAKKSSQPRISTDARSPSQESGSRHSSGKTKRSPREASDQSGDGIKQQVNLSFNRTGQRDNDASNGKTHIAQLHAVPGFTYFVDGASRLQKTEDNRPIPSLKRGVSRTWSFSAELESVKGKGGLNGDKSRRSDNSLNENGVNLKSHFSKVPSHFSKASKQDASEKVSGESSPASFDEDFDENSVAAVSAAALKKAIDQAQESIRIAKIIMDRKKQGLQDGSKASSRGHLKVKDKKEAKIDHEGYGSKGKNVWETIERSDEKSISSLSYRDPLINAGKSDVERVRENVGSAKEHAEASDRESKISAPSCSQGEILRTNEKVEMEKLEKYVESVEADFRTADGEYVQVGNDNDVLLSTNKLASRIDEMEAVKEALQQKEVTTYHMKGSDFFEKLSEKTLDAPKRMEEALAQCQETFDHAEEPTETVELAKRVLNTSQRTPEPEKIVDEASENLNIIQENEVIEEKETVTDNKEKGEENFEEFKDMLNVEYLTANGSEFDDSLNESGNLVENEAVEQEEMEKKDDTVPEWKENSPNDGESDVKENVLEQKEAQIWFESEEQLKEALEEEINETKPEIDDKKRNHAYDENEQILPEKLEQNEVDERLTNIYEYEASDDVVTEANIFVKAEKSEVLCEAEETNYTVGEDNDDKCEFQEFAYEKDIDEAVDVNNSDTSTVFSESQEACDVDINDGAEDNLREEILSAIDMDSEADKLFHREDNEMPEIDILHRSASEEVFFESKRHESSDGPIDNAKTEYFGDTEADHEAKLPNEDTLERISEIHEDPQECADKIDGQTLPQVNSSNDKPEEFDVAYLRQVLEQTSESDEGSTSTSSVENIDSSSPHESEECAENANEKTSNDEKHKCEIEITSNESKYEERNEEMDKPTETETAVEKDLNVIQTKENLTGASIDKNAKSFDKSDHQQRIEAIKKGREREKDRIVVERAIREARERAFAEARERAERAAVEKAAAEVRQRAMSEAREKASVVNKQPADKASTEAKLRAERAAVERATAEARERALEKAKTFSEAKTQAERYPAERVSSSSRNNGLEHSLSSSDLEKLDGSESAQRRKARLERHQRIMERAAKALAEKNMRDLLAQKEQAERNRLAGSLDADIKRWATGKEGNLRALLSTLQYILGADSSWQPISLTEIITTAAVKKAYRKATLYVHPDKLQQRGATIQQKYICEKVFDLLKAAWNRFNSEER